MKKLLSISCLIAGIFLFTNTNALAQNNFKIGGGIAYGFEVEAIGIQAGAKYMFTDDISGAADFIIFFPDNFDWFEINVNGHYHFVSEEAMRVYGLAGLNYTSVKVDLGQFGSASNSEVGLNIGGGAEFGTGFGDIYTEVKYVVSSADQLSISAGLRFSI